MITKAERKTRDELAKKMAHKVQEIIEEKAIEKLLGTNMRELDRWIKKQKNPGLDRFEAVRRLIEIGLRA